MLHELKCWPPYFQRVLDGRKTAEFREEDPPFAEGDYLHLREWSPETRSYTGRDLTARVSDVVPGGQFGIPEGYAVLSIRVVHDGREGRG